MEDSFVPFSFSPSKVEFHHVKHSKLYVMPICIQNKTTQAQHIRIFPPSSACFTVRYTPQKIIAPGMQFSADVEFQLIEGDKDSSTNENGLLDTFEYRDELVVAGTYGQLTIPLLARKPIACFSFSKKSIHFGSIPSDNPPSDYITIRNEGTVSGKWYIEDQENACLLEPSSGFLEANEATEVQVTWNTERRSSLRASFDQERKLNVEGGHSLLCLKNDLTLETEGVCDVAALVSHISENDPLPFTWSLLRSEGEEKDIPDLLNFGIVWKGSQKVIPTEIKNNSALPLHIKLSFSKVNRNQQEGEGEGEEQLMGINRAQKGDNESHQEFSFLTESIPHSIAPLASLYLPIAYKPNPNPPSRGFSHSLRKNEGELASSTLTLHVSSSSRQWSTSVLTSATSFQPILTPSSPLLNFELGLGDTRDRTMNPIQKLVLSNPTGASIRFAYVSPVPHFEITPSKGIVPASGELSLSVQYCPRSKVSDTKMIRRKLKFSLEEGLGLVEVKVKVNILYPPQLDDSNQCSSSWFTNDLTNSQSFSWRESQSLLALDEEERDVRNQTFPTKNQRQGKVRNYIQMSNVTEIKEYYDYKEEKTEEEEDKWLKEMTYSLKELEQKHRNKRYFIDYIRTKRREEEEKKERAKFEDGNDRLEEPPFMPLPSFPTTEDFYREHEAKLNASSTSTGNGRKALMPRTFKQDPESQAEIRDCAMALPSMDVLQVMGEQTLSSGNIERAEGKLYFGLITPHTVGEEGYLLVTNSFSHSVHVYVRKEDNGRRGKKRKKLKVDDEGNVILDDSDDMRLTCFPPRQVVPPNQTAKFSLCLTSPSSSYQGYKTERLVKRTIEVFCNPTCVDNKDFVWPLEIKYNPVEHKIHVSTSNNPKDAYLREKSHRKGHNQEEKKEGDEVSPLIFCSDFTSPYPFYFNDSLGNHDRESRKSIFLHNRNTSECPFLISTTSERFHVEPSQGTIPSRGCVELQVTWQPLKVPSSSSSSSSLSSKNQKNTKNSKEKAVSVLDEVSMLVQIGHEGSSKHISLIGHWFASLSSSFNSIPSIPHQATMLDLKVTSVDFGDVRVLEEEEMTSSNHYKASIALKLTKPWSKFLKSISSNDSTSSTSLASLSEASLNSSSSLSSNQYQEAVIFASIVKSDGLNKVSSNGMTKEDVDILSHLTLSSNQIILKPGKKALLEVYWSPQVPISSLSSFSILFHPRLPSSQIMSLSLNGNASFAPLSSSPSYIHAGNVSYGASRSWYVILKNEHTILSSRFTFDFPKQSYLSYSMIARRKKDSALEYELLDLESNLREKKEESKEEGHKLWEILPYAQNTGNTMIEPEEEIKLKLTWSPDSSNQQKGETSIFTHLFQESLHFEGFIVNPLLEIAMSSPDDSMSSTIETNKSSIDFGKIVITPLSDSMSEEERLMVEGPSFITSFSLKNTSKSQATFFSLQFIETKLKEEGKVEEEGKKEATPFTIAPSSGCIPPNDSLLVYVTFNPSPLKPIIYSSTLQLITDLEEIRPEKGERESEASLARIENEWSLHGISTWPIIDVTPSFLVLPPLPPSEVTAMGSFSLNNLGYEYCCISHSFPTDLPFRVDVYYPQGREMETGSHLPDRLTVFVYVSPKEDVKLESLSFSFPIMFYLSTEAGDADGDGSIADSLLSPSKTVYSHESTVSSPSLSKTPFKEVHVDGSFSSSFLIVGGVINKLLPPLLAILPSDNPSSKKKGKLGTVVDSHPLPSSRPMSAGSTHSNASSRHPGALFREGNDQGVLFFAENPSFNEVAHMSLSSTSKAQFDAKGLLVDASEFYWTESEARMLGDMLVSIFSLPSSFSFPSSFCSPPTLVSFLSQILSDVPLREIRKPKGNSDLKDILLKIKKVLINHQCPSHHIAIEYLLEGRQEAWCDFIMATLHCFFFPTLQLPNQEHDEVSNIFTNSEWGVLSWLSQKPHFRSIMNEEGKDGEEKDKEENPHQLL